MESGADLILVLGGDGTIHEVVNGMIGSGVAVGILPAGTANVLAMELGLGRNLEAAVARLSVSVERSVSVGRAILQDGAITHFVCMAGAGFDAKIVNEVSPWLKNRTGKFAYWVAGLAQAAASVDPLEVRVTNKTFKPGFLLASRVRNYGGDMEIARGASLLHDEFEIVLFKGRNPLRYAFYMTGVGLGVIQRLPGVHTCKTEMLEILTPTHLQLDGEYAGRQTCRIEIVPAALRILVPPSYR